MSGFAWFWSVRWALEQCSLSEVELQCFRYDLTVVFRGHRFLRYARSAICGQSLLCRVHCRSYFLSTVSNSNGIFFFSFLCLIKKLFQSLLVQDPQWVAPRLLHLPDNYNTIFQYYHRKSCSSCNKTPKDPALCLVCGAFVCLKGHCCKQQGVCECVLVSISLTPPALHRHPILMITLYAFFNL